MFTMVTESSRKVVSAVAAVAVVAFGGLALDQGHRGGLPAGIVEIGELTPVDLVQMAAITLPEVTVTGKRVADDAFAAAPVLPEVMVVASRNVQLADVSAGSAAQG